MKRIERLREYRTRLSNDVQKLASRTLDGDAARARNARVDILQLRMRLLNSEIDKLMAIELGRKDAQPNVPEYELAHA